LGLGLVIDIWILKGIGRTWLIIKCLDDYACSGVPPCYGFFLIAGQGGYQWFLKI
jgi:hypothetical protein